MMIKHYFLINNYDGRWWLPVGGDLFKINYKMYLEIIQKRF